MVGGELFNYKFFRILNGTLTMLSTGSNRSFNSTDTSTNGSQGTLAFHIDGDQVGVFAIQCIGTEPVIDPGAHLEVQLSGSVNESDSWVSWITPPVGHLRRRHPIYQHTGSPFELTTDPETMTC